MRKLNFNNEDELHQWIKSNAQRFLGNGLFLDGNFLIYTRRNKGAKPDGYYINFETSEWTIIETELISHGVWPHIAEQITRFSIASRNSDTLRNLRDAFFSLIERTNQIQSISNSLSIPPERLIKHIEGIIESNTPNIAIFIDDINEDLEDLAESLNTPIGIYKVQKFEVKGSIEYFSEDYENASFQTTITDIIEERTNPAEILSDTSNDEIFFRRGRTKFYSNDNNERYVIKYSKQYDSGGYWYGISPQLLELMTQNSLTHIILQMGSEGYLKLPLNILNQYLIGANTTKIIYQGTEVISHYHIHLNRTPNLELIHPINNINVDQYFVIRNS